MSSTPEWTRVRRTREVTAFLKKYTREDRHEVSSCLMQLGLDAMRSVLLSTHRWTEETAARPRAVPLMELRALARSATLPYRAAASASESGSPVDRSQNEIPETEDGPSAPASALVRSEHASREESPEDDRGRRPLRLRPDAQIVLPPQIADDDSPPRGFFFCDLGQGRRRNSAPPGPRQPRDLQDLQALIREGRRQRRLLPELGRDIVVAPAGAGPLSGTVPHGQAGDEDEEEPTPDPSLDDPSFYEPRDVPPPRESSRRESDAPAPANLLDTPDAAAELEPAAVVLSDTVDVPALAAVEIVVPDELYQIEPLPHAPLASAHDPPRSSPSGSISTIPPVTSRRVSPSSKTASGSGVISPSDNQAAAPAIEMHGVSEGGGTPGHNPLEASDSGNMLVSESSMLTGFVSEDASKKASPVGQHAPARRGEQLQRPSPLAFPTAAVQDRPVEDQDARDVAVTLQRLERSASNTGPVARQDSGGSMCVSPMTSCPPPPPGNTPDSHAPTTPDPVPTPDPGPEIVHEDMPVADVVPDPHSTAPVPEPMDLPSDPLSQSPPPEQSGPKYPVDPESPISRRRPPGLSIETNWDDNPPPHAVDTRRHAEPAAIIAEAAVGAADAPSDSVDAGVSTPGASQSTPDDAAPVPADEGGVGSPALGPLSADLKPAPSPSQHSADHPPCWGLEATMEGKPPTPPPELRDHVELMHSIGRAAGGGARVEEPVEEPGEDGPFASPESAGSPPRQLRRTGTMDPSQALRMARNVMGRGRPSDASDWSINSERVTPVDLTVDAPPDGDPVLAIAGLWPGPRESTALLVARNVEVASPSGDGAWVPVCRAVVPPALAGGAGFTMRDPWLQPPSWLTDASGVRPALVAMDPTKLRLATVSVALVAIDPVSNSVALRLPRVVESPLEVPSSATSVQALRALAVQQSGIPASSPLTASGLGAAEGAGFGEPRVDDGWSLQPTAAASPDPAQLLESGLDIAAALQTDDAPSVASVGNTAPCSRTAYPNEDVPSRNAKASPRPVSALDVVLGHALDSRPRRSFAAVESLRRSTPPQSTALDFVFNFAGVSTRAGTTVVSARTSLEGSTDASSPHSGKDRRPPLRALFA